MMTFYDGDDILELLYRPEDAGPLVRMHLNQLPLPARKRPWLVQYYVISADLADVMEETRIFSPLSFYSYAEPFDRERATG